ncbi:MAG: hypothetical protein GWO87_02190 [Xanthomonadaceae bacterium]|nr:hypothetical protein [Rhodospirillaceae bacterium]NIA17978.1 hypothetical protein [Xanthomonadaceae bacterium]
MKFKKITASTQIGKNKKEKTLWLSVIIIGLIIFLIWVVKTVYNIKNLS